MVTTSPPEEKKLARAEALAILNERTRQVRAEARQQFGPDFTNEPDYRRKILLRYPRVVAHLICKSLGYFCPNSAANAINHYKDHQPFFCEWYCHMADCTIRNRRAEGKLPEAPVADTYCRDLLTEMGANTLKAAFQQRHHHQGFMAEYLRARAIVLRSLAGDHPLFASWF